MSRKTKGKSRAVAVRDKKIERLETALANETYKNRELNRQLDASQTDVNFQHDVANVLARAFFRCCKEHGAPLSSGTHHIESTRGLSKVSLQAVSSFIEAAEEAVR